MMGTSPATGAAASAAPAVGMPPADPGAGAPRSAP
jgi:hypothetical protein